MSPGLRLGWTIGPEELIDKLVNSGLLKMGGGANPLVANAISHYCQQGFLEPHIALHCDYRDLVPKGREKSPTFSIYADIIFLYIIG
jgi:DNA-binding transcriptional MocR family regulator